MQVLGAWAGWTTQSRSSKNCTCAETWLQSLSPEWLSYHRLCDKPNKWPTAAANSSQTQWTCGCHPVEYPQSCKQEENVFQWSCDNDTVMVSEILANRYNSLLLDGNKQLHEPIFYHRCDPSYYNLLVDTLTSNIQINHFHVFLSHRVDGLTFRAFLFLIDESLNGQNIPGLNYYRCQSMAWYKMAFFP